MKPKKTISEIERLVEAGCAGDNESAVKLCKYIRHNKLISMFNNTSEFTEMQIICSKLSKYYKLNKYVVVSDNTIKIWSNELNKLTTYYIVKLEEGIWTYSHNVGRDYSYRSYTFDTFMKKIVNAPQPWQKEDDDISSSIR